MAFTGSPPEPGSRPYPAALSEGILSYSPANIKTAFTRQPPPPPWKQKQGKSCGLALLKVGSVPATDLLEIN